MEAEANSRSADTALAEAGKSSLQQDGKVSSGAQSTEVSPLNVFSAVSSDTTKKKKKGVKKKSSSSKKSSSGKKKSKRPVWVMPSIVGGSLLLLLTLTFVLMQGSGFVVISGTKKTQTANAGSNQSADNASNNVGSNEDGGGNSTPTEGTTPVDPLKEQFVVASDDGTSLWVPPSVGEPHKVDFLPMGAEGFIFLSDQAWSKSGGSKTIATWWMDSHPLLAKALSKLPFAGDSNVAAVAIALYPRSGGSIPVPVFRYTFKTPVDAADFKTEIDKAVENLSDELLTPSEMIWQPASVREGFDTFEDKESDGLGRVSRFTFGPKALIELVRENKGAAVPLRRQMEQLLQSTDSRHDLSLLFAPSFVFADGQEFLKANTPNLLDVARTSIDVSVQAVSLSTKFDNSWYIELRLLSAELKDAGRFQSDLKKRMEQLPDAVEADLVNTPAHPYWRALAARYPQMLRSLLKFTRFGIEDGQVIANTYLPAEAAGNVIIGSWMVLQKGVTPSVTGNVATNSGGNNSTPKPNTNKAKTMEELLESPISISLEQESLETVLALIASEFKDSVLGDSGSLPMAINGTAFQKDGITRNQQIRSFTYKNTPLRKILTDLTRRANPVTTVKEAFEKDQKIVWVVLDDADNPGGKKIDFTTRAWIEANPNELPREYVQPK